MKQVIVGLGEALWDCLPEGKKLGGAPANFAYHAGQFGHESLAISAVGNDALGKETLDEFDKKGVRYLMPEVDYQTGTVQVELDGEGVPTYDIKEGVAWDNIPFTPEIEEAARNCRALCFGSLAQRSSVSRQTIQKFLDVTPKDCLKIFDINLRQNFYTKEVITHSLHQADILKINDEELVTIGRLFGYPGLDMENKCWLLLGKYLGLSLALALAMLAGLAAVGVMLVYQFGSKALFHYAGFVLSALLMGMSFLSLAVLVSVVARDRPTHQ